MTKKDYRDAVDDISNIALDFAESKLHELIQDKGHRYTTKIK